MTTVPTAPWCQEHTALSRVGAQRKEKGHVSKMKTSREGTGPIGAVLIIARTYQGLLKRVKGCQQLVDLEVLRLVMVAVHTTQETSLSFVQPSKPGGGR